MIIVNQYTDPAASQDNLLIELPYNATPNPSGRLAVGCYYPYKNTRTGQYGWQSIMTVLSPSIQAIVTGNAVTSVGLSLPSELAVTNSPITSSGTLTAAWASQTANKVFASPNGADGTPIFRALTNTDLPVTAVTAGSYTNSNITVNDKGIITSASNGSAGTGTVTSVAASAGTGISISGSPITTSGTITITNTSPDQTVVLTAGTGIATTGIYPNFTITNTAPSTTSGTVTSIATAGLISGGTITNTGTITTSVSTNKLVGRSTVGTGVMEEIIIGSGLSLSAGTLTGTSSGSIAITIDGLGGVINTGQYGGYVTVPYSGTITGWDIFSTVSATITLDTWKSTYAGALPTVANTIWGTKPSLTATTKNTATGLSIAVTAGDVVAWNVDSNSLGVLVNCILKVTKSS